MNKYASIKKKLMGIFSPYLIVCKMLSTKKIPQWMDIFFWDPSIFLYSYLAVCKERKWQYSLHLYSDSMASYIIECPKIKLFNNCIINNLIKRKCGFYSVEYADFDIYLFKKEYVCYDTKRKIVEIPNIDLKDNKFITNINNIFSYNAMQGVVKEKYILLDQVWDELLVNKETREHLVLLVKNIVGKDNFAVKPHPREKEERYEKMDVNLLEKTIPWEITCINSNATDKIIITTDSSASIMPTILFDISQKVYVVNYLSNQVKERKERILHLYEVLNRAGKSEITIFDSEDEFRKQLMRERNK